MLRAYDKMTGREAGAVLMPAVPSGSPMTYMIDGKQYIVVAVSGGAYSGAAFNSFEASPLPEKRSLRCSQPLTELLRKFG